MLQKLELKAQGPPAACACTLGGDFEAMRAPGIQNVELSHGGSRRLGRSLEAVDKHVAGPGPCSVVAVGTDRHEQGAGASWVAKGAPTSPFATRDRVLEDKKRAVTTRRTHGVVFYARVHR